MIPGADGSGSARRAGLSKASSGSGSPSDGGGMAAAGSADDGGALTGAATLAALHRVPGGAN